MVSPGFRKLSWVRQAEYHQTVTITFFGGASLALGSALEFLLGPTTELAITGCHIKSTFRHTSQSDREMVPCCCIELEKMTLQDGFFFFFFLISGRLMINPLIKLFHLFNLLQMLSSLATSCVVVRGSALMMALSWLSASNGRPLRSSSSRLSSLAKLLEPPLHCTFISSSWAKCVADVSSCLCCFTTHFELE